MKEKKIITNQSLMIAEQLQPVVTHLKHAYHPDVIGILKYEQGILKPIIFDGLVPDALGRQFRVADHPRLSEILQHKDVVHFDRHCKLPDPYDGLLAYLPEQALIIHDCVGISLYHHDQCWGLLTLDAINENVFTQEKLHQLAKDKTLLEVAICMNDKTTLSPQDSKLNILANTTTDEQDNMIIGHSPQITSLIRELSLIATTDLSVLLLGETGVGKDLFARYLHQLSPRRKAPLIHINCAALPEHLAESELFGHHKGAFSGATQHRLGKFEAAAGGTVFLDEVAELPLPIQAKLLRVLQNGEIQRLGSDHVKQIDIRVVAATNQNILQAIEQGKFRFDLYQRLAVYPLTIPPLRERQDDILHLSGYFLERYRQRFGIRCLRLSPTASQWLQTHQWQGNIRELEHTLSRAVIKALSEGAELNSIITLEPRHLHSITTTMPLPHHQQPSSSNTLAEFDHINDLQIAVNHYQRALIEHKLQHTQGNWRQAAKLLNVDPSNLHKLAKRLGIKE